MRSGPIHDRHFSPLEAAVLTKMLDGAHPVLNALRDQVDHATGVVREFTGVGFWTDIELPSAWHAASVSNFELSDVGAEAASVQHGVGFVLFIRDGLLSMLEGFTYDEPWPDDLGPFTLSYVSGDDRRQTLARLDAASG